MSEVPLALHFLFPSSSTQNLKVQLDKTYIIQTLLKNSTLAGWKWLLSVYSADELATVLKTSKILTPREVYFWSIFLKVPPQEILCLNKDSQKAPKTSWAY